ncbi:hypothetical protein [Phenylobacterium sp.]|uniref:hypothetical protein n=1 Tax=Phenylobacterium sp. TaxID=1871053 RepID=UPI00120204EF|nr:hypothetical protein [Phenylobacterium sp.]THD65403.1 MAG: hypothetical protein E8A12_07065 [Phenylobacterium sp.]
MATAAAQVCAVGPAFASTPDPDALAGILLGARGPALDPTTGGEAIARFLVRGAPPHAVTRLAPAVPTRMAQANTSPAVAPVSARPAVAPSPAAANGGGDRIGSLLVGGAPAQSGRSTERVLAIDPRFPTPDPQTLLLLLVQLDNLTLTDGLTAYGSPDDPLLPVGELSRLLELDVDVSPTDGRITGAIGEARRALLIDLPTNSARIGPVSVALKPGDIAVDPGEIYVRASVLAKLLPLTFTVDAASLQMKIGATELLPIQSRLSRLSRLREGGPKASTPVMRVDTPYKLFTPPSFDVSLNLGAQTTAPKGQAQYDIRLGGDLLYAGLQAYFGSDQNGRLTSSRILLEKRSLDGDLLGPLHARDVSIGDVFTPGLSIGPRSLGGRGFALSTVPLDQTNVFNRIDLRGELPIGDDVELYVNDVLQGAQQQAVNGQYEFLSVPLTQGINVIRIVTYGPRGQRSEETRVINASGGLLRPGQVTFEFGAVDQNEPLLRISDVNPFVVDRTTGKARLVTDVNYGVTQYLTATIGGAIYTDQLGVQRDLITGGLHTSIAGVAAEVDIAGDNRGGEGVSVDIAGRLFGANTVLRQSEYRGGLLDENNSEADIDRPVTSRTELDVDQNFRFGNQVIPLSVRALRDVYADGGDAWIGQVRGSASLGSILYSTGFEYDRTTAATGQVDDVLRGFLGISTFRAYKWQVRATLDYEAVPDFRISGLEVVVDRPISNTWSLRFGATERLDAPKDLSLVAGSTTKTKFGDLAFTGQYDTNQNTWRFGAQMNFGLGYNPQAHGYELTRSGPGAGGSVIFHAFLDANGNGKFDPGERPVQGVTIEGGEYKTTTDAQGNAYISGFGAGPTARLIVSIGQIENQSVKTPPTVIEFVPRPGGVTQVEYPMRPTGEVMVNVKLRRPDQQRVGLSATRVRLVDDKGLAYEGVTEFDGSANFQDLPAGTYHLELDKDQAARLRMHLLAPVTVTIKPDGSITPDANADVEFEPRADSDAKPPG